MKSQLIPVHLYETRELMVLEEVIYQTYQIQFICVKPDPSCYIVKHRNDSTILTTPHLCVPGMEADNVS